MDSDTKIYFFVIIKGIPTVLLLNDVYTSLQILPYW